MVIVVSQNQYKISRAKKKVSNGLLKGCFNGLQFTIALLAVSSFCFSSTFLHDQGLPENTLPSQKGRKCIALGMITRSVEFDLRQWHRDVFQKHGNSNRFSGSIDIHLQFGMADVGNDRALKGKVDKEIKRHNDITIFDFEETEECMFLNRCLMRNHDQGFRGIQHLCDGDYDGAYFMKVDNDSVLNYDQMAQVFLDLPNESVLFGRLVPNTPVEKSLERIITDTSLSFYPVWPHGTFQGYSKDLLQKSLKPENMATILRPDVDYVFPWSDRGTGLELARAQITVKNKVFLKGHYFMCPSESFTCDAYWNSIAFHSGFGWSGKGSDKMAKKIEMMDFIYRTQLECRAPYEDFRQEDHYFFADEDFVQNGNSSYWLSYGCSSLNEKGVDLVEHLDTVHALAVESLGPVNGKCADRIYRDQWSALEIVSDHVIPQKPIFGSTEGRVADFSKAYKRKMRDLSSVGDSTFESRLRFIDNGHLSSSLHYYCPNECSVDGSDFEECASCDRETEYLKQNPDVANAVSKGAFQSGLEHYTKRGSKEGRIWSCQSMYANNGGGTKDGCYLTFTKFMAKAAPLMDNWPIAGDKDFQINPPGCNSLVIVDGRDNPMMDFILKNHRRYLGPYWMFYLVGPKTVTDIWQKYAGPMITVVELPEKFGDLSDYPDEYNRVLLSEFLWKETIQCENVLVSQTDALLFRHGIEDFFKYDYVGSPIYAENHPTRYWRMMHAFNDTTVGGNGGFSFRKKSAMIKAFDECEIPIPGSPEDAWSTACILLNDGKLPHPVTANRFGVGTKCEVDIPLGTHKLWMSCKTSSCEHAIITSRFHRDLYGEENFYHNCPEGELLYLASYSDIAKVVANGSYESGWQHFVKYGRFEKTRIWRCLERDEKGKKLALGTKVKLALIKKNSTETS